MISEYGYTPQIRHYYFATSESSSTYPTNCGAGSSITLVDTSTHEITGYLEYDGTNWNTV